MEPHFIYREKTSVAKKALDDMYSRVSFMIVYHLIMLLILRLFLECMIMRIVSGTVWTPLGRYAVVAFYSITFVVLVGRPILIFGVTIKRCRAMPVKEYHYCVYFEEDCFVETELNVIYTFNYLDIQSVSMKKDGSLDIHCVLNGDLHSFHSESGFLHMISINPKYFDGDLTDLYRFLDTRKGGKRR